MPSNCSSVPALEVPPGIDPSGKYLVIVNVNGVTRMLNRPSNRSILVFDGDDIFFADGSDEYPIALPSIRTVNETGFLSGLLAYNAAGRAFGLVNETSGEMVLKSQAGTVFWAEEGIDFEGQQLVPAPGVGLHGILFRASGATEEVSFFNMEGLVYISSAGVPTQVPMGNPGQVLFNVGGVPTFISLPSGNIASGSNIATLEAVSAGSISTSQVNVAVPSMKLSDGASDITVANVNVTVNLAGGVGALGLDTGAEQASTWYYIYIISDGTDTSAIISEDSNGPDLTGMGAFQFYGFVSLFRNDATGNIITFVQRGRKFFTPQINMSDAVAITTSLAAVPQSTPMSTIIPPVAKTCTGIVGGTDHPNTDKRTIVMAADNGGLSIYFVAAQDRAAAVDGFKKDAGMFIDLPILDGGAPSLSWKADAADSRRRISFTGYSI